MFPLLYGMRRGEVLRLRWSGIDGGTVRVRRQVQRIKDELLTGPVKTCVGKRDRPLGACRFRLVPACEWRGRELPKRMRLPLRRLSARLVAAVSATAAVNLAPAVPFLTLGDADNHHDHACAHDRDSKDPRPGRPKRYLPYGVCPPADGEQPADNKGRYAAHEPAVCPLAGFSCHLCLSHIL